MASNINVGLIGCGRIARLVHLNILRNHPILTLLAVAEPDPSNREIARSIFPGAVFVFDYTELLRRTDIDAAIICLPNSLHAEVAETTLRHGKHIYLEKPIALDIKDAGKVVQAWEETNLTGMIGFNFRFNPLYKSLRELIGAGAVGGVSHVRTVFSSSGDSMPDWKKSRASGGGALLDLGSHHIDLIRYILRDEIMEVYATAGSLVTEHDNCRLDLVMESGVHVQSYFSINSVHEDRVEVYGASGKLTVDRYNSYNVEIMNSDSYKQNRFHRAARNIRSMLGSPLLKDRILATGREPSFETALGHFASAVSGNHAVSPDLKDGYACLAVIEAAEKSAETGRAVMLNNKNRDRSEAGGI
jgi:UDP-N-acetylglucosamine 3-dehydrogenase